jgi:NtrC-family two-component system response regulator AlgB
MKSALIVDDDKNILTTLEIHLEESGLAVQTASTGAEGLERLRNGAYDLVFLDLKLPDRNGLELLREMVSLNAGAMIVIITAYATIDTAVQAVKTGAFDYLPKPFTPAQITRIIEMVRRVRALESENRALKGIVSEGGVITRSRRLRKVLDTARQVADSSATILITGESGTGKGMLARLLHDWSPRSSSPFVVVDCAGLHENLLESDLFGHRKGAFTGAIQDKEGKLKRADGGTVFLDEVSEMSPAVQAKFLRFLQSREFERLGDAASILVDVRIIAAANKDLEEQIAAELFRQDLYFRLNVVELHLPPLRERPEDIKVLAEHYLKRFAVLNGKNIAGISQDAMELLEHYPWPGNVRELVNIIERGAILCRGKQVTPTDLPEHLAKFTIGADPARKLASLAEMEKKHIQQVMSQTPSIDEAARVLDIDPATLWRKRKKYHLD